ncbi:DNA polymerase IV [Chengkuizengella axinellae]|uniref:DNA polymerase IV n=1 Tax=Chengkuizengella axinellae TaxID=3064388 RepID=A0ABT9IX68_9BACL|nr:DNA polymerase IV [Chengkuizengella sp. 2205SS18-9]MDP5273390.1 DNA polymerase IV [Chengkuizengella sp. 2205SS18-9]
MNKKDRVIMLVDCQSFYASVEKAAHPQFKNKPVVVAGDPARRSGIVLAACPLAKKYGVTTAERLGEAMGKCPDLIVLKPRMKLYIDVSFQITQLLETFTDLVEPYSIDEQFLDLTNTQHLFGTPEQIAEQIQEKIVDATSVHTRIGISYCKVVAKMACDHFAKKNEKGIFQLPKQDLQSVLWPLPIHKLFLVGSRMNTHLLRLGIHTIGDLADTPLSKLREKWGVNGELLWKIAKGMDASPVTPQTHEKQKGIGHQMTLPRDYWSKTELEVILLELTELVCRRCRTKGYMGSVVSVGCRGADFDRKTGFHRQKKIAVPTNVTNEVYETVRQLFYAHWDGSPVRSLGVSLTQLVSDQEYQLSMFDPFEKDRSLEKATDGLKDKYGDAIIMRAASVAEAGQAKDRAVKIGGHYK